ncbi:30S ribosomal protein S19 [Candidatus Woesearchaeota archaeon]|nr:30S ribosomal protein S19 [Candidatus Woesearchaeota archaeon]
MAKKEFKFKGKSEEELKEMSIEEFSKLVPSRIRRSIKRGFTENQKALLKKLRKGKNNVETHSRGMVILPEMIGKTIKVHNGKVFEGVNVSLDMVGHTLGEFVLTRKELKHSAPGIGATRSSAAISVK